MSAIDMMYDWGMSTVAQREAKKKADVNSGKVSHDDFLKLLVTQLTTQDPLNPMQDIDFLGQLAQLQALDEQMAMTKSMTAMRLDSQFQAGTSMIGKFVSGHDAYGGEIAGMVTRVVQRDGEIMVEMANGQRLGIGSVQNVWNPTAGIGDQLSAAGNLIGMFVDGGIDPDTRQPILGIVESVITENGGVFLKLYGGKMVSIDSIRNLRAPTEDEIWYTLPDDLRRQIETASGFVHKYVVGTLADGSPVEGIAVSARLSGDRVLITLFDGTEIPVGNIQGGSNPSLSERMNSIILGETHLSGINVAGQTATGVAVAWEEDGDSLILTLADGQRMRFIDILAVRPATADEKAALGGGGAGEPDGPED